MNLRTREHFTVPISNLSRNPKLMQKHYNFSEVEKNGMNGIMFFLQNYLSPVDSGRNIVKHRWWIRGVVSPNHLCWQINSCLRVLNEGKDLFNKLILAKRQREAYQERGINQYFTIFVIDSSFRFFHKKNSFLVR